MACFVPESQSSQNRTQEGAWLQEKTKVNVWTADDFEKADEKKREQMLKQTSEFLSEMILEWDVTDPETGELLPMPSNKNESLAKLPVEVNVLLNDKIAEAFESLRVGPQLPTEKQSGQP